MLWHAFLHIHTARTTVPVPRGFLRHCNFIDFISVCRCVPSTPDLHQARGVPTVSLPPSLVTLSLPADIVPLSRCTALTASCKWSWLHHVAAFMWSEILPAALAQGRVTLRALTGLSGTTHCFSVRKTGTSAEGSSWMDMEGGVAFSQRLLKINHHCPGKYIKGLLWRYHLYKWNTLYITPIHCGPSCNVALREDCSSRELGPWSWVFPKQRYQGPMECYPHQWAPDINPFRAFLLRAPACV